MTQPQPQNNPSAPTPEELQRLFLNRIYPEIRVMSFRMQEIIQILANMGRVVDPSKADEDPWFHTSGCLKHIADSLEKKLRATSIVIAKPGDFIKDTSKGN